VEESATDNEILDAVLNDLINDEDCNPVARGEGIKTTQIILDDETYAELAQANGARSASHRSSDHNFVKMTALEAPASLLDQESQPSGRHESAAVHFRQHGSFAPFSVRLTGWSWIVDRDCGVSLCWLGS
jgi:hypothetical protein